MNSDEFADDQESVEDVARIARELRDGDFRLGLERLSLLLPSSVSNSEILTVESFSIPGTRYDVNLNELSCNCPDFVKRRAKFPDRDVRRVCKHIFRFLDLDRSSNDIDELTRVIATSGCSKEEIYRGLVDSNHSVVLAVTPGEEWIDVFARTRNSHDRGGALTGEYHTYGFNTSDRTWSYGVKPVGVREIHRLLRMSGLDHLEPAPAYDEPEISRSNQDELFDLAWSAVQAHGSASTSHLQRTLKIGYGRASRLMQQMQQAGLIGPADGAAPQRLLVHAQGVNDELLQIRKMKTGSSFTRGANDRSFVPLVFILLVLSVLLFLISSNRS